MSTSPAQGWAGQGWLYDGFSAARRHATLEVRNGWLGVTPEAADPLWWPLAELKCDRLGDTWRIERPVRDGVAPYVLVEDPTFFGLSAVGAAGPPMVSHNAGAEAWKWLAAAVIAAFAILVFAWNVGLPWLAGTLAASVPVEWEERLGRQVAQTMAPKEMRCDDPDARQALDKLSGALRDSLQQGREYNYDVALVNGDVVNAFAAPGGSIVIYRGLIKRMATPDELAAVLAHEMQHVALRHSTRAIFRNFALQSALALMLGDPSGLLVQITGQLSVLKYMREDEEEADREGMFLMARAGFDPRGMTDMLESLSESHDGGSADSLAWLSSHPSPKARIAAVEKIMPAPSSRRVTLSGGEWTALKRACSGK